MRFPEIAPQLIANGYLTPVPIKPGTKYPGFPEWQKFVFDPAKAVAWSEYGTGLICGEIVGVDIDSYDPQVTESLRNLAERVLGPTLIRVGSPPKALLVYRATVPFDKMSTDKYVLPGTPKPSQVEVLCHGQQFVAFAIHPDTGKPYTWQADESPLNTPFSKLPELDAEKMRLFLAMADEILAAAAGVQKQADFPRNHTAAPTQTDKWPLEVGRAALALIQLKAGERDRWRNLAWALADMCGPQAFTVFNEWSRTQPDYTGEDDCMVVWQSNREKSNGVTRATLVKEANEAAKALGKKDPKAVAWTAAIGAQRKADHSHAAKSAGDLLRQDLIFVTDQGSYWSIPQRLLVNDRTIRALYLPIMPDAFGGGKENPVQMIDENPDKVVVRSVGYWPGREKIYTDRGDKFYNDYTDPGIEPLEPTAEERATWEWFVSRSFGQDADGALFGPWFLNLLAYRVQCPGEKIFKATLIHSPTAGNGKSTWSLFLPRLLLGNSNVSEPRHSQVEGQFNDFFAKAQLVHFDEIRFGGGRVDATKVMDNLKTPIDSVVLTINAKYEKPYQLRNIAWVTATSNRSGDALVIDDSERRWGIYELTAPALTIDERRRLFSEWLNTTRGPGTLKFLLLERDLSSFDPMQDPPETQAKVEMKRNSEALPIQIIRNAMFDEDAHFARDIVLASTIGDFIATHTKYPISPNALGMMLDNSNLGFERTRVLMTGRKRTAYIIRNTDYWLAATEGERGKYLETGAKPHADE